MESQEALKDIIRHIEICGPDPSKWHICITHNINGFCEKHGIKKNSDMWMAKKLDSNKSANIVMKYILDNLKLIRDGDDDGVFVLVYRK